jgi:CysZ protein
MNFFSGFFKGIGNCFKGFEVLFNRGLWPLMFYPLIIWIILYVASIYGVIWLADGISNWLRSFLNIESIPEHGHWLSFAKPLLNSVGFFISWTLRFLFWITSGTLVKYILLIILSPVFSLLSEKTEEKIGGEKFPFSFVQLLKDIARGTAISLRNLLFEYLFIFGGFVLCFFFPPLILFVTPFLFFIGWYFVGFTLLDYNCERHRYSIGKSVDLIRKNKGYACGIGFVYSFFLALPFLPGDIIGIMCGPALGVIGATLSFLEMNRNGSVTVS